jgi:hypothetical protein
MVVYEPSPHTLHAIEPVLGEDVSEASTLVLDVGAGEEAIWEGYEQQVRRSVRRAARAGVTVRRCGPEALPAFHAVYAAQARGYTVPWHHSRPALERLVAALGDGVAFWLASRNDEVVCAQLALERPGRDTHLWISGARAASRPVAAFHFLLHELILDAARRGQREIHFGASLGNRGVEAFKRSFRPAERVLLRVHRQARWVGWIQGLRRFPRPRRPGGNEST